MAGPVVAGEGKANFMNLKVSSLINRVPGILLMASLLTCWLFVFFQMALLASQVQQGNSAAKSEEKQEAKGEASQSNESGPVPRVSLSEITGSPGASLMLPFYYTPDPKQPLRSVAVDIDYVSNHLKFDKISRGVIPDDVAASITANVTDGAPDAKTGVVRSKLHLSVSLTDKDPQNGLPDGLLAYLLFNITTDAKPFTIKLIPTLASGEDLHTPPRKIARVSATPGLVVVEVPDVLPEATCFFFTH